jgi:hypothetical protein
MTTPKDIINSITAKELQAADFNAEWKKGYIQGAKMSKLIEWDVNAALAIAILTLKHVVENYYQDTEATAPAETLINKLFRLYKAQSGMSRFEQTDRLNAAKILKRLTPTLAEAAGAAMGITEDSNAHDAAALIYKVKPLLKRLQPQTDIVQIEASAVRSMEFDTEAELKEYKKTHKVRPDTKLTVKKTEKKTDKEDVVQDLVDNYDGEFGEDISEEELREMYQQQVEQAE